MPLEEAVKLHGADAGRGGDLQRDLTVFFDRTPAAGVLWRDGGDGVDSICGCSVF